ncbi:MAG: protein translocase subunit SecD [bacterium]|nr:protein translocase subunit SecD [bacterium]
MTLRRVFISGFMFWVVVAVLGLYFVLPLKKSIRFGSDLVGGTFLTLEVQTQEAVGAELVSRMQGIEAKLKRAHKSLPKSKLIENEVLKLTFETMQDAQDAAVVLKSEERELEQKTEGTTVSLFFPDRVVKRIKEDAVTRNIEVLRTRLDRYSVAEIPIFAQGERNIVIELPDVADSQQAKAMIGRPAQLDFRLVEKAAKNPDDILYEYDGELPDDKVILPSKNADEGYYLVQKYSDITGKLLKDARPGLGGPTQSEPTVQFKFNEEGAEKFYDLTSKNYNRSLAIVLDNVIISAPRINEPIKGEGHIIGRFTPEEARELALLLKSGSFVAKVTFEEERQIGPALGADSRYRGLLSCLVGLGLVFLFSIYIYNLSGFFAFLALVYNMILILIGLSWLHATLTLPGIAGMVLTIGMAIDASILIFERIREELKKGIAVRKAVDVGFSDAMAVILDANITTFIVGVVLYNFGTGPIQGFAVTLMLGFVATLMAGLFFLKSLFTLILDNFNMQ